jgi:hypothetical protein
MAHIVYQPATRPSASVPVEVVEDGVSRYSLVDWPGWWFWGVTLHQRSAPPLAARGTGCFFNSSGEEKCALSRPSGPGPEGLAGMAELRPLFPGGLGARRRRSKATATALPKFTGLVKCARRTSQNHSCARDQVVIARPPVLTLTPPRRYRRSLVSKGCFTTSTKLFCVGNRLTPLLPRFGGGGVPGGGRGVCGGVRSANQLKVTR